MVNLSSKYLSKSRSRNSKRQELEVNIYWMLAIAAAIALAILVLLLPVRESYLGVLIYDRGPTQFLVIFLAGMVVAFTALKFITIQREYKALNKIWIADHIPLQQHRSPEVSNFQERLSRDGSSIATRCARILAVYISSGDRQKAAEFALDDSSFYLSSSESSYSFPRILVWAIPLLGFIGTVVGISTAVSSFSGVLEGAGDVERIKEGIGMVTSGLAVAFDTTLLALFLSVLVMIPLVLVERYESRFLLAMDIFINDRLLPRLRDKPQILDETGIEQTIQQAIASHFPNPEKLIEPAREYAQQAASILAQGLAQELKQIEQISQSAIAQIAETKQLAQSDRQNFMSFFEQQQQANQQVIDRIKTTIEEIRASNTAVANGLSVQSQEISQQLENAAVALENRIVALEKCTSKVADLSELQRSLDRSLQSLEQTARLEEVLNGVRDNLSKLQPILKKLNKPRRITLVEQDNGNITL